MMSNRNEMTNQTRALASPATSEGNTPEQPARALAVPATPPLTDDERTIDKLIGERDDFHDWADKLAEGIAAHLGIYIGEHTAGFEANNPWANALAAIQSALSATPQAAAPEATTVHCVCGCEWELGVGGWGLVATSRASIPATGVQTPPSALNMSMFASREDYEAEIRAIRKREYMPGRGDAAPDPLPHPQQGGGL